MQPGLEHAYATQGPGAATWTEPRLSSIWPCRPAQHPSSAARELPPAELRCPLPYAELCVIVAAQSVLPVPHDELPTPAADDLGALAGDDRDRSRCPRVHGIPVHGSICGLLVQPDRPWCRFELEPAHGRPINWLRHGWLASGFDRRWPRLRAALQEHRETLARRLLCAVSVATAYPWSGGPVSRNERSWAATAS